MKDEGFFASIMFLFIISVMLIIKLLKWLEICLAMVINWLSIRRLEMDSSDLFFKFIIPFMVWHTSFSGFFVVSKVLCVIKFFCLPK